MAQNLSKAKIPTKPRLTYKHTIVAKIFYIIYPSLISYQLVKAWYCFSNLRQNTKLWHTRCNRAGKNTGKRLVLNVNLTSKKAAKLSFQSNRDHWDNAAIRAQLSWRHRRLRLTPIAPWVPPPSLASNSYSRYTWSSVNPLRYAMPLLIRHLL